MAAADLRAELSCSICLSIYTDPVSLPCGHNFCRGCIGTTWDTQEGSGAYSCPECRAEYQERPAVYRNRTLGNIAERFRPTETEPGETGIFCTYCAKRLQKSRREVAEKEAGETERVTALFRDIREQLEELEERLLSDISRQKEEISIQLSGLIQHFEIKKDKLSSKIRQIEELCNMADPLTVLQEWESHGAAFCGAEGADNEEEWDTEEDEDEDEEEEDEDEEYDTEEDEDEEEDEDDEYDTEEDDTKGEDNEGGRERHDIKVPAIGDLDVDLISETLLTGLAAIVTGVKGRIYGQEATDLLLDIKTAGNEINVSVDRKSTFYSDIDQCHPQTPERFQDYAQALSTRSFPSGRHYWEVEGSDLGCWKVGVAYPSIERGGDQSCIGNNNKSWCLYRWYNNYTVRHDRKDIYLPHIPSCRRIRISLDYEAGRLSFYELSEPIRHLHTFTATFTEPLHAAFWVWGDAGTCVRIIN